MTLALGLESTGSGLYIPVFNCGTFLIRAGGLILVVAMLVNLAAAIVALTTKNR